MPIRTPGKATEHAFAAIRQFTNRNGFLATLLALLLTITLGWFGSALFNLLTKVSDWASLADVLCSRDNLTGLLLFPLMLGLTVLLARGAVSVRPVMRQFDAPAKVRGLILFLSPPGKGRAILEEEREGPGFDSKTGEFFRYLQGPNRSAWQMPLEAIHYHRERIEYVVVITSADRADGDPETDDRARGTWRDLDLFRDTVARLDCSPELLTVDRCAHGVDFENAALLVDAIEEAYQLLDGHGLSGRDVLIDITGGQKVATVAGAASALADGRLFQYVSTHDHRPRTYDVTYGD